VGYTVERLAYPDGQPEVVVADAYWPRLSDDGRQLVYVSVDPETFAGALFVAGADGGGARRIAEADKFTAVDAPLFTPDGQSIIFSAVSEGAVAAGRTWLDWLTGAEIAYAHNVPSDWWKVPLAGGEPVQLTQVFDLGLYGDFAPDGRHMVFISAQGLRVIQPDGTGLTQLIYGGAYGSVDWIP
jgi:Tol biopolymer transport system component